MKGKKADFKWFSKNKKRKQCGIRKMVEKKWKRSAW